MFSPSPCYYVLRGVQHRDILDPRDVSSTVFPIVSSRHATVPMRPRKIYELLWGPFSLDPRENRLLVKIDWFVLSYVCLIYWVNYLDRTNFQNAYLTGLKEALGMKGYEYNVVNTCFTVGYTVGMVPNNIALLKLPPRYWLSFCALAWGVLVLSIYKTTNYRQLCVIRFFQAFFESSTFSGTHFILGNWYRDDELTKRSAVFTSSGLIGSIFSGFMQSSIHSSLDGRSGLAGWQWLFIIDFIITVPIAIYGFVFFPDVPEKASWVLSTAEKELARQRLPPRDPTRLDWSVVRRIAGRWHWWLFSLLWAIAGENESFGTNTIFGLWLEWAGYPTQDRNDYPLGMYAVGVVATLVSALYIDLTGARYHWHVAVVILVFLLIASIVILTRPLVTTAVFVAHYLTGVSYAGQAAFFAWANVVCHRDLEERAITLASMNMFNNAVNAWWSILFYKANDAPYWRSGCWAMIATTIATVAVAVTIRILQVLEQRGDGSSPEVTEVMERVEPKHSQQGGACL